MTVYLVGAGPGDPGLLTLRGAELLRCADVVLYDRLVTPEVLSLVRSDAQCIDVGKRPGTDTPGADRRQHEIGRLLLEHGRSSATVVRLKGGDPFVFGRGGEEITILEEARIPWQIVPGVTSALGVAGAAGIPVTHRGLASSVSIVTGHTLEGGTAPTPGHEPNWEALAQSGGTLVILMGMASRAAIAAALVDAGRAADTPVAVIQDGTTPTQRMVRTTLAGLPDVDLCAPAIIVVGPVVDIVPRASRTARG
ncbi:MAG: uroporphyrinogen-III C-methyltransferase [Actinomycetota bacterium]|nr:uroporphyrinogen-III C-methyltransferase [Actinomycetota bacterium]